MAKGFTDKEKRIIQDRLLSNAEICWGKYGIKKTSIDELVRMTGISKGAFYLFYPSKELLFLDALVRVDRRIKNAMLEAMQTSVQPQKQNFITGMKQMYMEVLQCPWIVNLQSGDYELLIQKLPEEAIKEHLSHDEESLLLLFKQLNVECDVEFVSSVMKAIFFTVLHKNEISADRHEEVVLFFIESLAERVFKGR